MRKDNRLKVGILKIRELSLKLPKYLGIERIGNEPKLWLEEIGERTKLGVFWSSFIIVFLYFFLFDMFSLVLTIGRPIDIYPRIKNYMFFTLSWQVIWWFALYFIFYIKNIYLTTVNSLFDEKRITEQDFMRLRLLLLSPKYRFSIRWIFIIFLGIMFINSLIYFSTKPDILWGFISLEEIGLKHSDLALIFVLIYTILRWIGNFFQVIVLADLFTIIIGFLSLGNESQKILKVELLNADRRGGYGLIGILYFKIAVLYLIALSLFFAVTRDYPINHPSIIGRGSYWLIITMASLFAFILLIFPQFSIHKKLIKTKGQCIKKIVNKLNEHNVQDLKTDNVSIDSLRIMLLLNEIDKMKTYSFSDGQLLIISIFMFLINLFNNLLKLKELFPSIISW